MSGLEAYLYALDWNNNTSVTVMALVSYDYILQFDKEVTFVWQRQWSAMSYLYLVVRYLGIILAMLTKIQPCYGMFLFMEWGFSVYSCLTEVILIWRLYVIYNKSKLILYALLGFFLPIVGLFIALMAGYKVQEITLTPNIKYCTASFHIGPATAVYASIPVICFDIFLVVLAIIVLKKHLKEQKELQVKPNTYIVMIVRYHVIYFVLYAQTVVMSFILLFKYTAPLIIVPRLIISIWDTHANENCVHVSTTFEDCVCWTSPPPDLELPEIA
ncbi:hypothetical protein BDR04DRAFT_1114021 [Suillus decipiens]|nr:hypothetical protein BDR04DRAFT_1114021 [Suillus decipiens]